MKASQTTQALPMDDIENVGIMQGFLDMAEDMDEIADEDEDSIERMLDREPDSPEILMNNLRGDMRSIEARREELADMVGYAAAAETPDSVLALLQPVIAMQQGGGIGGLPQSMPMAQEPPPPVMPDMGAMGGAPMPPPDMGMPPGMPPPGMPPGMPPPGMPPGMPPEMPPPGMPPGMPPGGQPPMQMAAGGLVQRFQDGSDEEGVTPQYGTSSAFFDPATRDQIRAQAMATLGAQPLRVPTTEELYQKRLPAYRELLGDARTTGQAQMLFDIAQRALAFGANVDEQGRPLRGSFASRMMGAFQGLPGALGARAAEVEKAERQVKGMALSSAEKESERIQRLNEQLEARKGTLTGQLAKGALQESEAERRSREAALDRESREKLAAANQAARDARQQADHAAKAVLQARELEARATNQKERLDAQEKLQTALANERSATQLAIAAQRNLTQITNAQLRGAAPGREFAGKWYLPTALNPTLARVFADGNTDPETEARIYGALMEYTRPQMQRYMDPDTGRIIESKISAAMPEFWKRAFEARDMPLPAYVIEETNRASQPRPTEIPIPGRGDTSAVGASPAVPGAAPAAVPGAAPTVPPPVGAPPPVVPPVGAAAPAAAAPSQRLPTGSSLFEVADKLTGPVPEAQAALSGIPGLGFIGEANTPDRVLAKKATEDLIEAALKNSKAPLAEQNRLRGIVSVSPGLRDVTAYRSQVMGVANTVYNEYKAAYKVIDDPESSRTEREEARKKARAAENLMGTLLPPIYDVDTVTRLHEEGLLKPGQFFVFVDPATGKLRDAQVKPRDRGAR